MCVCVCDFNVTACTDLLAPVDNYVLRIKSAYIDALHLLDVMKGHFFTITAVCTRRRAHDSFWRRRAVFSVYIGHLRRKCSVQAVG